MILSKFWRSITAQVNKLANFFWTADPIAQMQYEYDKAVEEMKGGREGLEQYRGLVERVTRQVIDEKRHVEQLQSQVKAYLSAGDRETAGKFAVELNKAKTTLAEKEEQLVMHEKAYDNNVRKIKKSMGKLKSIREKIHSYDAELKMSRAEAEMAELAKDFNFDVTTDFGQIEQVIQEKISHNRGKARVAADLSGQGIEEIAREEAMEQSMAEDALRGFEIELGLVTPQTANISDDVKEMGPGTEAKQTN